MEHIYLERLNKKQIIELNKIYFNKKKDFISYLNKFISSQNDLTAFNNSLIFSIFDMLSKARVLPYLNLLICLI